MLLGVVTPLLQYLGLLLQMVPLKLLNLYILLILLGL